MSKQQHQRTSAITPNGCSFPAQVDFINSSRCYTCGIHSCKS